MPTLGTFMQRLPRGSTARDLTDGWAITGCPEGFDPNEYRLLIFGVGMVAMMVSIPYPRPRMSLSPLRLSASPSRPQFQCPSSELKK